MTDTLTELEGEFRRPRNTAQNLGGSIHDDATASKLGFRGGTVAGSIHMNQFVPLILKIHGERWFEHGDLSAFFTKATVDNEPVRAVAEPGAERARFGLFDELGDLICEATASLNPPDAGAEIVRRMAAQEPAQPGRLRILADLKVGDTHADIPLKLTRAALDRILDTITEDLPIYRDKGVLPPGAVVHLAHAVRPVVLTSQKTSVGLFGALEIRHLNGPFHADVDYLARTEVLKLSESPRTENVWYDVTIRDPKTDKDVGLVRFQIRLMKGSSPLWAEELKAKGA